MKWFNSYLSERKQQCWVNGHLSSPKTIKCGIPQGSIIGPLLFLIYINDLPNCLKHSNPRMSPDDTNIITTSKSITKLIQFTNIDLKNISDWLLANKLSLNVTKTEQMFMHPMIHWIKQLKRVRKSKSLGISIDERLFWTEHIDIVSKKVSSLKQVRSFIDKKTAITVYNSLIQPLFDYSDIVWDTIGVTLATRLQKLNNRAGRTISQLGYKVRSSDIRSQLGWTTLEERRSNHKCIMTYKILHDNAPIYLKQHFLYVNNNREYHFRGSRNLILPKPKTDYPNKSFIFSGAKIWNSLPLYLKLHNILSSFKWELKSLSSPNISLSPN